MLISVGERISVALAAMAIKDLGHEAISSPVAGRHRHRHETRQGEDRRHPRPAHPRGAGRGQDRARRRLPGRLHGKEITTLGRGGSDTTAVALAVALSAEACEIYTDVEGVFTADPRIVPDARKLDSLTYEEMLELSACGAKVMSFEVGGVRARHGVRSTCVRRSATRRAHGSGRRTTDAGAGDHLGSHARHLRGEGDDHRRARPAGHRRALFRRSPTPGNIDMIVQNVSEHGQPTSRSRSRRPTSPSPSRPRVHVRANWVPTASHRPRHRQGFPDRRGMKSHPGVAADMFDVLAEATSIWRSSPRPRSGSRAWCARRRSTGR